MFEPTPPHSLAFDRQTDWNPRISSGARRNTGSRVPSSGRRQTSVRTHTSMSSLASPASTIMAILENRAHEIGFATVDLKSPQVVLTQVADSNMFPNLSSNIQTYAPTHIVLPNTAMDTRLHQLIRKRFESVTIAFVGRRYFNEAVGVESVQLYAANDTSELSLEASAKFLCLSACAALIKYVEYAMNTTFAVGSLSVNYKSCDGFMLLSMSSATHLELLFNLRSGNPKDSLFGAINSTCTSGGKRLLRATLLQPLTDLPTLKLRLDCVEEMMARNEMATEIRHVLELLPDLEQLLSHLAQVKTAQTAKLAHQTISDMIALSTLLCAISTLRDAIGTTENELLRTIHQHLEAEAPNILKEKIDEVIDPNLKLGKLTAMEKSQQAFSIRSGINGLLDVARKTHIETIEDMYSLTDAYKEHWKSTSLQLKFTSSRGYHLVLSTAEYEQISATNLLVQPTISKKRALFTTEELLSLNERNKESMNEICLLTDRVLEHLQVDVRQHMAWLLTFSEAVSLLDMLLGFATLASNSDMHFCRPEMCETGEIAVKNGRNMLSETQQGKPFVPNDTFLTPSSNVVLLSGPNMSGKSTYLRQVAQISILAQCGSFVPAQYAHLPVITHLFTRLSTDDSLESNLSTFAVEMKEIASTVTQANSRSLVLIDELGRATSVLDGVSIAWSVVGLLDELDIEKLVSTHFIFKEDLAAKGAFVVLTTHFKELQEMSLLYPCVRNQHLQTRTAEEAGLYEGDIFVYKLKDGLNTVGHDMKYLAKKAGFPSAVTDEAIAIKERYVRVVPEGSHTSVGSDTRALYTIGETLASLKRTTLDENSLRELLDQLRKSVPHF